jgi:hypothetical protein
VGGDARVDDTRVGDQHHGEVSNPKEILTTDFTDLKAIYADFYAGSNCGSKN